MTAVIAEPTLPQLRQFNRWHVICLTNQPKTELAAGKLPSLSPAFGEDGWSDFMTREDGSAPSRAEAILDEAESLTWLLLDDQLAEDDADRLAKLLDQHEEARRRYVECVQLHADLQDHFAVSRGAAPGSSAGVVVLPNLLTGGLPGAESHAPASE